MKYHRTTSNAWRGQHFTVSWRVPCANTLFELYCVIMNSVVKNERMIWAIVLAVILVLSQTSVSSPQHIVEEDLWFRMNVTLDGHTLLTGISPFASRTTSGTIFIRLRPAASRYEHNWEIWYHDSDDEKWSDVTGIVNIYGDGDGLILKWEPAWWKLSDIVIQQSNIAGVIRIQRDNGSIKKGTFISTGCWIQGQTKAGWFYGGCTLTGESAGKDMLPFLCR